MRVRLAALLLVAVALAGCGGGGSKKSVTAAGSTPAGASVAPRGSAVFVAVATDAKSAQWRSFTTLAPKVPAIANLLKKVPGGDIDALAAALGPETDLVAVTADDADKNRFVGLAQPSNLATFKSLLAKQDPNAVVEEIAGWQVFADDRDRIDRFKEARNGGALSDLPEAAAAFKSLPADALARAYVSAESANSTGDGSKPGVPGLGTVGWAAASLGARDDGFPVQLRVQQTGLTTVSFTPEVLSSAPAGSALAFDFSGLDKVLQQIRKGAAGSTKALAEVERFLSKDLDRLVKLFSNEGLLYAVNGPPRVLALRLEVDDEQAAFGAVDSLAAKVAPLVNATPEDVQVGGVDAKKLHFKTFDLFYGVTNGTLVVANSPQAFGEPGEHLVGSDAYKRLTDAAGLGDITAGLLYADVPELVELLKALKVEGDLDSLAGLGGALFSGSLADGVLSIDGFLGVR